MRPSVPQSEHGHFLQPEGLALLEGWFPGFTSDALSQGAVLAPPGHHRLFTDGVPADFPDVTMLMAGRPFLEDQIRRRITTMPHVEIRQARVTGLRFRGDAVGGVAYRPADAAETSTERSLDVDIAVDATGRSTKIARWLRPGGFEVPLVERVPVGVSYVTALFDRPGKPEIACALDQFAASDHQPSTSDEAPGGMAVYAIEGNLWQVVTMTYGRDQLAATVQDLRDIAAQRPAVFQEATRGNPVGKPVTYYYRESVRHSVPSPESYPTGLLSLGDAVASFNPVLGQGMLSAAKQASVLADFLSSSRNPAAETRKFIRLQDAAVDELWHNQTNS
ncbi:hypothetical protein AB0J83_33115 [Actinoplanes sp. NPDC049596]|uniref:hypothetical protein n=1 Tax=unclassified Actinoplanes TaxID=2626549 RepID=UPI00343902C7